MSESHLVVTEQNATQSHVDGASDTLGDLGSQEDNVTHSHVDGASDTLDDLGSQAHDHLGTMRDAAEEHVDGALDTLDDLGSELHAREITHDDCEAGEFSSVLGYCEPCSECLYCSDGVDGTCGHCGEGYPTLVQSCGPDKCNDASVTATDAAGHACTWYSDYASSCGSEDDSDFTASATCCACGGDAHAEFVLWKPDVECLPNDGPFETDLGMQTSAADCRAACVERLGLACNYFIFGKGNKSSNCWHESDRACNSGEFQPDDYDVYKREDDAAGLPSLPFFIVVEKEEKQVWHEVHEKVTLDGREGLRIKEIKPAGLIEAWNQKAPPGMKVLMGDVVIKVERAGEFAVVHAHEMNQIMQGPGNLTLTILHDAEAHPPVSVRVRKSRDESIGMEWIVMSAEGDTSGLRITRIESGEVFDRYLQEHEFAGQKAVLVNDTVIQVSRLDPGEFKNSSDPDEMAGMLDSVGELEIVVERSAPRPFNCIHGVNNLPDEWEPQKREYCETAAAVPTPDPFLPGEEESVIDPLPGEEESVIDPAPPGGGEGFDCSAGLLNWETGWSLSKKDFCCKTESWRAARKEWCCRERQIGCEEPQGEELPPEEPSGWQSGTVKDNMTGVDDIAGTDGDHVPHEFTHNGEGRGITWFYWTLIVCAPMTVFSLALVACCLTWRRTSDEKRDRKQRDGSQQALLPTVDQGVGTQQTLGQVQTEASEEVVEYTVTGEQIVQPVQLPQHASLVSLRPDRPVIMTVELPSEAGRATSQQEPLPPITLSPEQKLNVYMTQPTVAEAAAPQLPAAEAEASQLRFSEHAGSLDIGSDMVDGGVVMTLDEAKAWCAQNTACVGFTVDTVSGRVFFKSAWSSPKLIPGWMSYRVVTEARLDAGDLCFEDTRSGAEARLDNLLAAFERRVESVESRMATSQAAQAAQPARAAQATQCVQQVGWPALLQAEPVASRQPQPAEPVAFRALQPGSAWTVPVASSLPRPTATRAVAGQARFSEHSGVLVSGNDLISEGVVVSLEEAKAWCSANPACVGFTVDLATGKVYFKSAWVFRPEPGWVSYKAEPPEEPVRVRSNSPVRADYRVSRCPERGEYLVAGSSSVARAAEVDRVAVPLALEAPSLRFSEYFGFLGEGNDLVDGGELMTLDQAKEKCLRLPGCVGFTVNKATGRVFFKSIWNITLNSEWMSYKADLPQDPWNAGSPTVMGNCLVPGTSVLQAGDGEARSVSLQPTPVPQAQETPMLQWLRTGTPAAQ